MLIFPKSQVASPFPVLRIIEPNSWRQGPVLFIIFFFWWGGVGVYPLRALYPIPRQALGYVRPLLNIKSPPSASVFSLRRLPDSQGHDHICPTIPRVGGEREGREQLVYMRQIQKGCYSGPRPRACPKSHSLVHSVSACDLRCTA